MPGYHGEGSPFIDSFDANAAPLVARIAELERRVAALSAAPAKSASGPVGELEEGGE